MKFLTLLTMAVVLLGGGTDAKAEDRHEKTHRPTIWTNEWRHKQTNENIDSVKIYTEEMNKAGKGALTTSLAWRALLTGGLCALNGVVVGGTALLETVPVVNLSGTVIGSISNPDYADTQRRRLELEAASGVFLGGGINSVLDALLYLPLDHDWYSTRVAYAGTHAADVALFSNASDCRLHAKKTAIAFDLLFNGSVKDPRVMANSYFQKKELQRAEFDSNRERDSASAE